MREARDSTQHPDLTDEWLCRSDKAHSYCVKRELGFTRVSPRILMRNSELVSPWRSSQANVSAPMKSCLPIGAGGMGEVYRARDIKLNRNVALKVLTEAFVQDPDRMARFEREAKLLASLNHPNIASIYGLEDSNHIRALVMELVEGPTLAGRIQQGAIAIDEVLPIAKQISEALEYAHERGIIHRDLKPANIKLTSNDNLGTNNVVKILRS